jgi:hypothetical protein
VGANGGSAARLTPAKTILVADRLGIVPGRQDSHGRCGNICLVSYDVFLTHFRNGEAQPVDSPDLWKTLADAWDAPPDESGFCRVRRRGDEGDLYAEPHGQPITTLMFNHSGPSIYHLMYDAALAGDMVILPVGAGPFLVSEDQREDLPPDLATDAVVVQSGDDLLRAIEA